MSEQGRRVEAPSRDLPGTEPEVEAAKARRLSAGELEELRRAAADVIAHTESLLSSRPEGGRPATDWAPLDQIWRSGHRIRCLLGGETDRDDGHGPPGPIVA